MLKKQDVAADLLALLLFSLLFLNQFMFKAAARVGEKEGQIGRASCRERV